MASRMPIHEVSRPASRARPVKLVSSSSRILHHLQGQIVLWDRFIHQLSRFQRHYPWTCFFLRGGTSFCSIGSASSSEPSHVGIIPLGGEPLLSLFLSFFSFGCIFTWGGLDYLIHSCILSSLFWGGFSHMVFSLFPHFMRDVHLHFVLGYLTWPSSWDPSF